MQDKLLSMNTYETELSNYESDEVINSQCDKFKDYKGNFQCFQRQIH